MPKQHLRKNDNPFADEESVDVNNDEHLCISMATCSLNMRLHTTGIRLSYTRVTPSLITQGYRNMDEDRQIPKKVAVLRQIWKVLHTNIPLRLTQRYKDKHKYNRSTIYYTKQSVSLCWLSRCLGTSTKQACSCLHESSGPSHHLIPLFPRHLIGRKDDAQAHWVQLWEEVLLLWNNFIKAIRDVTGFWEKEGRTTLDHCRVSCFLDDGERLLPKRVTSVDLKSHSDDTTLKRVRPTLIPLHQLWQDFLELLIALGIMDRAWTDIES